MIYVLCFALFADFTLENKTHLKSFIPDVMSLPLETLLSNLEKVLLKVTLYHGPFLW